MGETEQQKITDHELYKELLFLNFHKQNTKFNTQIAKAFASLIIINGEKEVGVEMLMDRLTNPITNQEKLLIELNGNEGIVSSEQVWQKLAKYFGISFQGSKKEIILSKIQEKCRELSFIMIFKIHKKDIPTDYLDEIAKEVFHPILENQSRRNKCLIFFLGLGYNELLPSFKHKNFFKLSAKKFTEEEIEDWVNEAKKTFSDKKLSLAFSAADPQSIYQDSKSGNPRLVYQYIYQIFHIEWFNSEVYKRVSKCLI